MGGRGGSSGGGGDKFEKIARSINPNATAEQIQQFTETMQGIRAEQVARTEAITREARNAIGVTTDGSTTDIAYITGFRYVEQRGKNKFLGIHQGHQAIITTVDSTRLTGGKKIIDVKVERVM
jgi:hypothetical protein